MNSITTRNVLIGAAIVIVLVLLGYLVWQERQNSTAPSSTATSTSTTSTSTGISVTVASNGTTTAGYTVRPVTMSSQPTAPNYKTPVFYSADMNAAEKSGDESQFATIQTVLASNPTDYSSWIALGLLREATGDYQGAAADWTYVTEIYPTDPTAFANLGDLYANYLKEPSQGIAYYKEAIKLDPTKEETFYQNLAQIYISENDTADAKAVLQQGITAQVVGYQNLQTELNSLQ